MSIRLHLSTTVIGVPASFNEINEVVWNILRVRALLAQRLLCKMPETRKGRPAPMDNSLMIVCLIAAFVWIQMLTPPVRAEQKEDSAVRENRGDDEQR